MTVYPRRRVRLVPKTPDPGPRYSKHPKEPAMRTMTATVYCGRKKYEATISVPSGATTDVHAMESLKNRLRLMIAQQIIGEAPIKFRTEKLGAGHLRRVR